MMKKEYSQAVLDEIGAKFPRASVKIHAPRRTYVSVPRDDVYEFAKFLFEEKKCRLSIATGIDKRDGIEILYHFSHDPSGTYYNIKTLVPKDDLKIRSLADFLPAANWIEREIHELLGVDFTGHPNLVPLLTAETWPADLYPLRRDYADEHKELKIEKTKEDH
ncbi:MAG: NADH-quinone oxidoreductase subunit C [candidate division WOR-3 bacterium]|nr:MAG: NADH-quinone oxidoreductase subunit C [candidate division WOR-3 bacterium]